MFDEIASLATDPQQLFDRVAKSLAAAGELHRLFDLRLMQERNRLGLAIDRRTAIEDVDEPLRSQLEAGYLAACREVGQLLLEAGRLREAWMYLRPAGDKQTVRTRLARERPDDEHIEELIELALFEMVDPERGFAWLLCRRGTCSAITTLDGMQQQLSVADVKACAAVLLRHVYAELRGNLRGHLSRLRPDAPSDFTVREIIERYPELLAGGNFHLDASHLASTIRYSKLLTDRDLVEKALEIAEYGSRLPSDLQYPGEPPFEDLYPAHRLLLKATLDRDVEDAIAYFADKAQASRDDPESTAAVETYLILLVRAGRAGEALRAYGDLVPADRELSAHAPTLLELAGASGEWDHYAAICRSRNDLLAYTAGLVARLPR